MLTCFSPPQRRFYAGGQSLTEPLVGLKLSPGAAHSYQDVHVCWDVSTHSVLGWNECGGGLILLCSAFDWICGFVHLSMQTFLEAGAYRQTPWCVTVQTAALSLALLRSASCPADWWSRLWRTTPQPPKLGSSSRPAVAMKPLTTKVSPTCSGWLPTWYEATFSASVLLSFFYLCFFSLSKILRPRLLILNLIGIIIESLQYWKWLNLFLVHIV